MFDETAYAAGPLHNWWHRLTSIIRSWDYGRLAIALAFLLLLPLATPRVALSDEVQYVAYLRSIYFDGDLDFRNEYAHFAAIGRENGDPAVFNALLREDPVNPHPVTGRLRNVAPVGSAILWAPGFVLADGFVRLANRFGAAIPANGYSAPYIWGICFMTVLYSFFGLQLSYGLARRFAGIFAATLATLTLLLATPLVFYTFIAMPWSHAPGFFLAALFLTVWLRGWERPLTEQPARRSFGTWALLGLIGGLMTITREQLGLLLIMPAAEALVSYVQLARARRWPEAGRLLATHLLFLGVLVLVLSPQLLAYQVLNGQPRPSATVAGKLNFLSPNFFNTLIDQRHGAFLWAPVLPVALIGLIWLGRRDALLAALLGLGFLAQTYINGAFGTTWHLSGSFGFRRLIECTPIFIIGLAVLLQQLQQRVGPWPLLAAALLLVYWNVGLIAQWTIVRAPEFRKGLIWEGMLRYQFIEVPRQVSGKLYALLFDRCRLVTNC